MLTTLMPRLLNMPVTAEQAARQVVMFLLNAELGITPTDVGPWQRSALMQCSRQTPYR